MATKTGAKPNGATEPQIEVEVESDPGLEVEVGGTADTSNGNGSEPQTLEQQLAEMREKLAAADKRAENAEAERARLASENRQAQVEVRDSRLVVLDRSIEGANAEKAQITAEIRAAKEAGDYDAEIAATDKLQQVNIRLTNMTVGKSHLEQQIEDAKTQPQIASRDDYINSVDPASRDWLNQHRDLIDTNGQPKQDLVDAHFHALSKRAKPGTEKYFTAIEEFLADQSGTTAQETTTTTTPRDPDPPAASVRGNTGGAPDVGGAQRQTGRIRLTRDQVEAAQIAGLTPQQYAEQLRELERTGEIGTRH